MDHCMTITWDHAVRHSLFTGDGFRRAEMPLGDFIVARDDNVIPDVEGFEVTVYAPTVDDLNATNWRLA